MPQKHKPLHSKPSGTKKKQHHKSHKQNQILKWVGLGFAAVVIIVAIILILKVTGAAHISVAQAYQKYQQGAFFLDVRSQEEWDQVHIANSTSSHWMNSKID